MVPFEVKKLYQEADEQQRRSKRQYRLGIFFILLAAVVAVLFAQV